MCEGFAFIAGNRSTQNDKKGSIKWKCGAFTLHDVPEKPKQQQKLNGETFAPGNKKPLYIKIFYF